MIEPHLRSSAKIGVHLRSPSPRKRHCGSRTGDHRTRFRVMQALSCATNRATKNLRPQWPEVGGYTSIKGLSQPV